MATPALAVAGVASGFEILSGLFGFLASREQAAAIESRAALIEFEAEAEAERFADESRAFGATQRLAFIKAGVRLEGSVLDVLDETARVSSENLSALRSRRRLEASDLRGQAFATRLAGRSRIAAGFVSGAKAFSRQALISQKSKDIAAANRRRILTGTGTATGFPGSDVSGPATVEP